MAARRPDDVARELGLDFTTDATRDGKYLRFAFKTPPMAESATSPKGVAYYEAVSRITQWRKKVGAWMFSPPPPGEGDNIVAAELTFSARFVVAGVNRKNRKALKKFWSGEAMARRAAMSQPTPQQGLFALREQLAKYGVKKLDEETQRLMLTLEKASAIVESDDSVIPLRRDGAVDVPEVLH